MPKKVPPHLPPQICDVGSHRRWDRIKILLLSVGFGLLAGVTGASVTLAWIWPGYGGGDTWVVSQRRPLSSGLQLEEKVNQETRDRIFSVFSNSVALNSGSYTLRQQDKLGDAIAISSDGWLAMYLPTLSGSAKNWRVVGNDGTVYNVDKVLPDYNSGMTYLRVILKPTGQNSNQLKVATFQEKFSFIEEVFVFQEGNWHQNNLGFSVTANKPVAHLDTAASEFFSLNSPALPGSIVINSQGRVAGFVNSAGVLLPNVYITRIVPSLLQDMKVSYYSLGVEGLYSREQAIIVDGEDRGGFVVSKVLAKNSLLKKGDIILDINGKEIEAEPYLWYNKDQKVRVTLLRNGKSVEVETSVVEI